MIALIVIPPDDLPVVMRAVGKVLRELRLASNTVMRELSSAIGDDSPYNLLPPRLDSGLPPSLRVTQSTSAPQTQTASAPEAQSSPSAVTVSQSVPAAEAATAANPAAPAAEPAATAQPADPAAEAKP